MSRATEIKAEIERLQSELSEIQPAANLSVRQIAKRAGISPATAHRFKQGMEMDPKTLRALIQAGLLAECPICKQQFKQEDK